MQAEKLKAIGERLSEERQKKSISLDEVAAKTYIPLRLLKAIEAGQIDLLPEPVFIQGFIRRYADILGLDGASISKEFPVNSAPTAPLPQTLITSVTAPAPVTAPASAPEPKAADSAQSGTSLLGRSYLPFVGVGILLGLGLIFIIGNMMQRPRPSEKTVKQPSAATPSTATPSTQTAKKTEAKPANLAGVASPKPVSSIVASPKVSSSPSPTVAASPKVSPSSSPTVAASPKASASPSPSVAASPVASPAGPVQVKMNLTEESWVEVFVDGQSVFEGNLPKGTQRSWAGKKQVVVTAGNAGGVSVSYNNSAAKTLGTTGQVQTASFPPQN